MARLGLHRFFRLKVLDVSDFNADSIPESILPTQISVPVESPQIV